MFARHLLRGTQKGIHLSPAQALVFLFFVDVVDGHILLGFPLRQLFVDGQRPLLDFFIASHDAFLRPPFAPFCDSPLARPVPAFLRRASHHPCR